MKFLLLVLVVGAVSCGKYDKVSTKNGSVGSFKSISPVSFTQPEQATLTNICNALAQKAQNLAASAGSPFSFQSQQTDCSGNVMNSSLVSVTLQSTGNGYVFKRPDGSDFIFPEVETNSSGMLAQVCPSLFNSSNPIQVGNDYVFVTTSVDTAECVPASGEVCVQVDRASLSNGQAQVHTSEIMRVRIQSSNNSLIGFFTFRKKFTRAYCGDNEAISLQATLK